MQIEGNLGAGVTEADDECSTPAERFAVRVVATVDDGAWEGVEPWPARHVRFVHPAGRDDDMSRTILTRARRDLPHSIFVTRAAGHLVAEFRAKIELARVLLEILRYLVARRVCRESARERAVRQGRMTL